jgi:hypothetical protein
VDFLKTVENPNTRTNKAFSLIRLRRHFGMPVVLMEGLRDETKSEIRIHRKQKSKENFESLMSYAELLEELEKLSGRTHVMNYMWIKHGLQNQDINVVFKSRKPAEVAENTVVFNPRAKKPKATYYIVDYKTAGVHGDKAITITDRRFFDEMRGLGLKNNQCLHATQTGAKASVNYMNVLASKNSVNQHGETRTCKILVRHLLDTKQYDRIEKLSKQRGTQLSTMYTTHNLFDSK